MPARALEERVQIQALNIDLREAVKSKIIAETMWICVPSLR